MVMQGGETTAYYDSYLSKHGGFSNAYTEAEHTCYYFDVNREFLNGALKRFSQFFISPLVKAEAMERELEAVDSEFNQALQNDGCRLQQLQCHTSGSGHPFNRFFWGNKKSLVDAMDKGIDMREQILHLYKESYNGSLMKLVVIGGGLSLFIFMRFCAEFYSVNQEPLDILEDWVAELFGNVKEGRPQLKSDGDKEVIWKASKLYRLEAVKDVHSLNLTWALPCLHKEYLKKPEDYLAHLLGHEGRGSLHFFLKAKGWATSLSAGVGDEGMHRSSIAYIFSMCIYLTDSGLDKVYEVIGVVYQYIKLLHQATPQEWIFKELQDIGNMEFKFAEEQPPDDYAVELAGCMGLGRVKEIYLGTEIAQAMFHNLRGSRVSSAETVAFPSCLTCKGAPVSVLSASVIVVTSSAIFSSTLAVLLENLLRYSEEHIVYGGYAFELWDAKLIKHVLTFLRPENMRIDILSKSIDKQSKDVQYEPWFGSQYTEEDISQSLLELWKNPPEIDISLHLPLKNEFIPCDFSIRGFNSSNSHASVCLPKCIVNKPFMKFWYKLDDTFKVPRANTYFLITVKGGYDSVKNCVLTELFINLLKDELNEILYQAGVAKLETSLSTIGDKLELKVYGFNDKLSVLLSRILTIARGFSPTGDRFKVIKEDMERAFRNTNMKSLSHSSYLRLQALRERFWDVDDKLSCLVGLSVADLKAFIPELLSQVLLIEDPVPTPDWKTLAGTLNSSSVVASCESPQSLDLYHTRELYIEGLCHGNLSEKEVLGISDIFIANFPLPPLSMDLRHEERTMCLPPHTNLMRDVSVKNKCESNSVVELYFQIEQDIGTKATNLRALADLFDDIVEEPIFNQLRTKEQLGYVVQCGPRITYRVLGFCFCVQSSKYDPIYLHRRVDKFIDSLQELLHELDDESFENHKNGLISNKLEKDPSLAHETNHLWGQIVDKRYLFDMSAKEAEELKNITKSDVIEWYNTYLRPTSPKCRRLAIHLWGCNTVKTEEEAHVESATVIEDLSSFKMSAEYYRSLC
ncbi:hypothetical protein GIB67_027850 [Kingdonia uniflora]|uniref:Uncharacterized protein n=1 Tax=Kingdonia uniflora TaxID=39325 RepID=A0A7J7P4L0_9MAGN|nr:hypothetical protein GIB67_027850 [Kingdonia uniflora]